MKPSGIVLLALALCSCSVLPPIDGGEAAPVAVPPRAELAAVPFHPQEEDQCGPAALATALGAAGVERSPAELRGQVFLPARRGSLQAEMLAATRRAGLLPYQLAGGRPALYREVAAGHPVLVLQNLGFAALPRWHYAVVVGYDLAAGEVVLRSGGERRLAMDSGRFERSWAAAGHWAFVALPPDRLPATADEKNFVAAAAALEAVSPAAAATAYRSALAAWPHNPAALLGLGNAAYRQGDLDGARMAFARAAREQPDAGDAWNNLAQVLHELGRGPEARAAAQRALAAGGPRRGIYAATLAEIDAAPPGNTAAKAEKGVREGL